VGLGDNEAKPKRKGLFSRFGDEAPTSHPASPRPEGQRLSAQVGTNDESSRPGSSGGGGVGGLASRFHLLTGRRRGHSGQGNELANMDRGGGKSGTLIGHGGKEFHLLPGRKRGQSGKGEDQLGSVPAKGGPAADSRPESRTGSIGGRTTDASAEAAEGAKSSADEDLEKLAREQGIALGANGAK
jgi:hypothetical protein